MSSSTSSAAASESSGKDVDKISPPETTPKGEDRKPPGTTPPPPAMEAGPGDRKPTDLPGKHRCGKCGYSTRNQVLYDNHTCEQQDEDGNLEEQTLITLKVDPQEGGRRFHCSECDVWAQGHAFEEHLMCHIIVKPYQCLYCSQCFVNRRDIGRHVVKEHVGMKMNCALRALKRAKGLMKATAEAGTFQFYACVAGKVPLPGDPEKSKNKLKKARSEAESRDGGSKTSPAPQVESSVSKGPSVSKPSPKSSQNDSASGSSVSDSSSVKSGAPASSKTPEDLKDSNLSAGQTAVKETDTDTKSEAPSAVLKSSSEQGAETSRDTASSQLCQKAGESAAEPDTGTDRVASLAETADSTDGKNTKEDSDDKVTETVEVLKNMDHVTDVASKSDEIMDSANHLQEANSSSTASETQNSTEDRRDPSCDGDKSSELGSKSDKTMDIDNENDTAFTKLKPKMDDKKDLSHQAEPENSALTEDTSVNSDEITQTNSKTNNTEDVPNESRDDSSKTDDCADPSSTTHHSDDSADVNKVEDSAQSSESTNHAPMLEKSADELPLSTTPADETEATAKTEDGMEGTSSHETKDSVPAAEESSSHSPTSKEETTSAVTDETVLPEAGEEPSDSRPKMEETDTPMETDEAMETSSTPSGSLDSGEQPRADDAEGKSEESAEADMDTENLPEDGEGEGQEKGSTNENDQNSSGEKALSDDKVTDKDELSDKMTTDAEKVESTDVDGVETVPETNGSTVTDNTEPEDTTKTSSSNLKLDSSPVETGNDDTPVVENKEAKDLKFPASNFDQSEEEESGMGLKIVAAFSLQEDGAKDSTVTDSQATADAKAGDEEKEVAREAVSDVKELSQDDSSDAAVPQQPISVPRTLGPPSKPVPSSSFLGVSASSDPITSQGFAARQGPHKNCFFFVCGFSCTFSCLTSPEFRDHLMLDHAGESSFRCFHCGYQSASEDGLVRHISAHAHTYSKSVPLYICGASACKFGSNLVNDFITHQSAWHPDLTAFHCHDCDERFEGIEDLLRHFEANFLHIINCPHCTAKTTERRTLLNHISSAHPGKPKMVSVAKQIVCRDRKLNSYAQFLQTRNPTVVSALQPPVTAEQPGASQARTKSLVSILTQPIQPQERELRRQAQERELTRQVHQDREQATSSSSAAPTAAVKLETVDDDDDFFQENFDDSFDEEEYGIQGQGQGGITYMGSKPDDREVDNFKCQFCTFIARDRCRLDGHERCHGLPPSRKSRFKCMYCPQGFNNEHKFSSHVSCHPGLIKFSLYCCKFCDFDSNQRHILLKHVRGTRDQVHLNRDAASEEDMFAVLSKSMESRVLECNQCSYMTRHRKHLVAHLKREHSTLRRTGITVDCDIVEKYPSQSLGANRNKALEMALSHDLAGQLPVGDEGFVKENQARRFKCPICQYLVPRAADLKAHVKRHSEIGEITLVMFRCKYCSAASTAREIIYGHLMEKHLGKQIALVKRIVTIDTKGNDNGYAVTSMEDEDGQGGAGEPDESGEPSSSGSSSKPVLVIPDAAGETFTSLMQCPVCAFGSYSRKTIIQHASNHHPEVAILGRRPDNELYPLETTYTTPGGGVAGAGAAATTAAAAARFTLGESLKGEILIVPDSQTFDEAVLCPKCDYATIHRRNIVLHLEQNHPEVSVMGRNDYPTFDGKGQAAEEANATGKDGMVIIGSGSLDEKIRCLYENFGDRMRCMICQAERPKKFFIHVHILRHLNILLWGCQFCSHRGLQKYKMMDHIKKVHPGRAFCIRYLPVNVEERVNQYLQNASVIRARRSGEEGGATGSGIAGGVTAEHSAKSPSSFSATFPCGESELNSLRMKYKASQDRLSGCTIGSEDLDMKLACLYSVGGDSNRYRCVVCAQEFQRKFAVHRHIVQAHLKVNLIGCGYCDLEGVERHIMMDHIIETHKNAPINMRNLAHNLHSQVADFLSRMTLAADDTLDLSATSATAAAAGLDLSMDGEFKLPEPPQLSSGQEAGAVGGGGGSSSSSSPRGTPPRTPSPSTSGGGGGRNQLNPNLLLLGRDILHRRLSCMIREAGSTFSCEVCKWDFPRRYAVHRHILMKHLKVGIIGCPYCPFEGVERYQVFTHIREDHKDAELSLRYLSVDLDSHVAEFMKGLAEGTVDPHSKVAPPWSMKKVLKKEAVSDEDSQDALTTTFEGGQGLLVAMFSGNKKSGFSIKEEPKDEDDDGDDNLGQEPLDREVNGDESGISYDRFIGVMGHGGVGGEREVSSTSLLAANGTKAKVATDVQTNIRVITIKEKGFKRHICEKCKFTSLHRSNIVRHIYRVHEQYREHECPVCNYKTLSRVLIEQHIGNEHPGTPIPEAVSNHRTVKRKFEMSHEELEYDSMKKCKAAATSKRREADLPLLNSTSTQLYACAYCNFETMTHSEIVRHTRDNHSLGEPMKPNEDEEEGIKDDGEGRGEDEDTSAFETAVNVVKMQGGGKVGGGGGVGGGHDDTLWQCFYCSFKTSGEDDLRAHFAETHPGNVYRGKRVPAWRFVCRSCHVKTRAHSKMRYHLNRHINYRPYTCTTCGAFYPSPDQCRKHCRANMHNETFTYVKIPRKERRLQELLRECQEIAVAMARSPAGTEASLAAAPYSPVPSKRKAKKSFSAHSRVSSSSSFSPSAAKLRRTYEYDAPYSPRGGGSGGHGQRDDRPKEDGAVMVCACCDFSAQNVCDVWLHFIKEHQEQEFRWLDSATGYICTETGEITNAKDNPPDLEAPPGPGYSVMSSRLLSCEHCEFTTSTVQAMKSHLRRHLPKRYLCPYCSLRCSRRDTINQHVRCGHKGRELWTIFFRLPEGFVADSDNAESNLEAADPAQGEDGEQSSTNATGGSERSSSAPDRIKCGQCDVTMANVAAVYKHHREDHPGEDFLWVDVTNGYTCNRSGLVMDAREQSPHLFTQDGYSVEQGGSMASPSYCCRFCPFTSAFVQAIKSHMKSHLPHGFMCPFCCMSTNSKEKMMSHQSCMHREQDPWILHLRMPSETSSVAGSTVMSETIDVGPASSSSQQLQPPQTTGVTQYACNECDYTSDDLYQYRLHLASHGSFPHLVRDSAAHSTPTPTPAPAPAPALEDLPFRCGYCAYVAEDEGDFGAHLASHLERRNFRCSKCEFTAFQRSAVQTHIQTTHDETEEIEVIDLQAAALSKVSEQGKGKGGSGGDGGTEEPQQLVNLEPKVKVVPVNDLDLDREGLTLFSPPPTPDEEGLEGREGSGEGGVNIIGLETPSIAELDNQSDSTEEWGTGDRDGDDGNNEEEEDVSREGSPAGSDSSVPRRPGSSILRLTLQGKLTGEYGIKRAVPADKDAGGDVSDASGSGDSYLSAASDPEEEDEDDGPSPETLQDEEDPLPDLPEDDDDDGADEVDNDQDDAEEENENEREVENDDDEGEMENDDANDANVENDDNAEMEIDEDDNSAEVEQEEEEEEEDMEAENENEEEQSPELAEDSSI
ncbi:uncharacterized protein LOC143276847 [Babylonia areolata]|uniref:uncharacterized protein LOC143276847 n=1 Tax=Babylonia areolata TaxID=304850 RepID=UPI003FD28579